MKNDIENPIFFKIENPILFKIDDVSLWCEDLVNAYKDFIFDNDKDREFVECCKDLLEECIYLNESVFLKDKTIRIRKVRFDNNSNEVWIGEWEEILDRVRDGCAGYYRFGVSGQFILDKMEKIEREILEELKEEENREKVLREKLEKFRKI